MPSFNFIRRATGMTCAFAILASGVALAATPAEQAQELMQRANTLRRAGDDEGALPILQKAYELYRSPRTSAQLGIVESALGRWVDVDDHLTYALKAVDLDV